ncbi:hypothetical protein [Streptomyces sp. NPDC093109]|uniref:hypothetical protein n=1 Tax=Streptomyces sp. NPDC093109 TaxID=3154977 RepID=UPI00344B42FF
MPTEDSSRPARYRMIGALIAGSLAIGGLGAWFLIGSQEGEDLCSGLLKDKRMHEVVGIEDQRPESCEELGESIKKATGATGSGQNNLKQAQAMKNVLLAAADHIEKSGSHLPPDLRSPIAEALTEYVGDTHIIIGTGSAEYVTNGDASDGPWTDDSGVHISVYKETLFRVLRSVSEDPHAYAVLRMAEARHAAKSLSSISHAEIDANLMSYPVSNARALAAMDALADAISTDHSKEKAAIWQKTVVDTIANNSTEAPAFKEDPAGHITAEWANKLSATAAAKQFPLLREEGIEVAGIWAKAQGVEKENYDKLLSNCRGGAESGYRAASDTLKKLNGK